VPAVWHRSLVPKALLASVDVGALLDRCPPRAAGKTARRVPPPTREAPCASATRRHPSGRTRRLSTQARARCRPHTSLTTRLGTGSPSTLRECGLQKLTRISRETAANFPRALTRELARPGSRERLGAIWRDSGAAFSSERRRRRASRASQFRTDCAQQPSASVLRDLASACPRAACRLPSMACVRRDRRPGARTSRGTRVRRRRVAVS
jgi:hypothetical protein